MIGTSVAHYKIVAKLGEGGMGEVYQAMDTKLNRQVALKILPPLMAADRQRMLRFEREAELLAALDHPNIGAIHGIEDVGETKALVLHLIEGQTLAERIAEGPIPIGEALPIALQMTRALEAAHEKGIIHRDLKPANIKLTPGGQVKVLDFGLAKAGQSERQSESAELSHSPTLSLAATQAGVILGTAAYMSPQQARGQAVDAQADIWAFGCVFLEMLSGRAAFSGTDLTEVLAAVIRAEPDWENLPVDLSGRLKGILQRCLEKDLKNRWHNIADVRLGLEDIQEEPESIPPNQAGSQGNTTPRALWLSLCGFGLGAILTAAAAWNLVPGGEVASRTVHFGLDASAQQPVQSTPATQSVAITPDGKIIAYVARPSDPSQPSSGAGQVYLRRLDRLRATRVAGSEGAENVFFSPDGEWLGFVAAGQLQRVSVNGGAPLRICAAQMVFGASWGHDDTIFFGGGFGAGLMRVPAAGGTPTTLTSPDSANGETQHGHPKVLPGGRSLLFTIGRADGSRVGLLSLQTGKIQELLTGAASPVYLPSGHLVFSDKSSLRAVRFDTRQEKPVGAAFPALEGVQWGNWGGLANASFALSSQGDLVFVPGDLMGGRETRPVWVDRGGRETPIEAEPGFYLGPRVSPDDRGRLAIMKLNDRAIGDVWVMNPDGSQAFPIAAEGADYNPTWKTGGTIVTYTSGGNLFERTAERDDPPSLVLARKHYQLPRSWDRSGELLAFDEISLNGVRIWIMPLGGDPEPLLAGHFNSAAARFSPQGDWIAYVSEESGEAEVYVRAYPGTARGEQVSRGGGKEPVWARDGSELFYRQGTRMMAVSIATQPVLRISDPEELWSKSYFAQEGIFATNFDVASDGRFLMIQPPVIDTPESARLNVLLHWFAGIQGNMNPSP